MNKEAIIAVIIGVTLGLLGAVYFSNLGKTPQTGKSKTTTFQTTGPLTKEKAKSVKLADFGNLPKNGTLSKKSTLSIKGKAENSSHLFWVSQIGLSSIKISGGSFDDEIQLKPGLNEIVLFELNNDKEQLKVLRVYYFQPQEAVLKKDEEATDEADILKEKLEDKVFELRNSPQKVVNGQIKSINDKILTLVAGSETVKLTVEPEITKFYDVDGNKLSNLEYSDLALGDTITAFISSIGGEEISYTVYREPELKVFAGKISNVDKDNYQVTVINYDKSSFGADIQVATTQNLYSLKTRQISEGGFSKLAIGQHILAIASGGKDNYSLDEYLVLQ